MCFSYIGGKSRIGKWIKDYIPENIETYCEPFAGAFWTYFNMDLEKYKNLKNIIYNDANKLNSNLFACIKNYNEFHDYMKDISAQQRDRFYEYQENVFNIDFTFDQNNPNYEYGLQYIYIVTQVFSGSKPETSNFIDLKGKYRSKFDSFRDKLVKEKWQLYFDKINIIENLDFEKFINKYDDELTYFYNDPPYVLDKLEKKGGEEYYSNHTFTKDDHKRLSDVLTSINGKFSLSYYYFNELDDWYPKYQYHWESKDFSKAAAAKEGKTQNKGTELLIMNY